MDRMNGQPGSAEFDDANADGAQPSIALRPAEPGDLEAVLALIEGAGHSVEGIERGLLLMVEDPSQGGRLVGCGTVEKAAELGLIRGLVVVPSHAGLGVSQLLLEALEFSARANGIEALYWFAATNDRLLNRGWAPTDPNTVRDRLSRSADWQVNAASESGLCLMVKHLRTRDAAEIVELIRAHYDKCARLGSYGYQHPNRSYRRESLIALPDEATELLLGCGNPLSMWPPRAGETVLDLGCGAGIDLLLAARKVGEAGYVIGVDLSPGMLARARTAITKLGATNIDLREAQLTALPVASGSVDLVTSNCAINLTPDKPAALAEAFRVLRPGGRLIVADVVTDVELPEPLRSDPLLLCACIGGALMRRPYVELLRTVGFEQIQLLRDVDFQSVEGVATRSVTIAARKPGVPPLQGPGPEAPGVAARQPAAS